MTDDPRAARSAAAARSPAVSPSAPPEDEPKANSPADLGVTHRPRAPKARPPTDREVLEARRGEVVFDGSGPTGDPLFGPYRATVRRKDGKARVFFGATEAEALRAARTWIERQAKP